jgi:ubiquitin carboxyl-terminal hydrolase 9/24
MAITISPDQQRSEFKLDCHSNETLLSIKHKVSRRLSVSVEHVTMGVSDRWLDTTDLNKLISQLEFGGPMVLIIKTYGGMNTGYSSRVSDVRGVASVLGVWLQGGCLV